MFLFSALFFTSAHLFAQNQQIIEAGLLKSFKRISYWDSKLNDTTFNAGDSLDKANYAFG